MKKGDLNCLQMNCNNCPFGLESLLKACTSFKLKQPIKKGLENSPWIVGDKRQRIINDLEEEI